MNIEDRNKYFEEHTLEEIIEEYKEYKESSSMQSIKGIVKYFKEHSFEELLLEFSKVQLVEFYQICYGCEPIYCDNNKSKIITRIREMDLHIQRTEAFKNMYQGRG